MFLARKWTTSTLLQLLLLLLLSCSQKYVDRAPGLERRNVEEYYDGSPVVEYMLPHLPQWANFSQSGNCQRQQDVTYFHLPHLQAGLNLNYSQALQLQIFYNFLLAEKHKENRNDLLRPQDEEMLFYEASKKAQSGLLAFTPPTFPRVHLVWIDDALTQTEVKQRLHALLHAPIMEKGFPVLVSLCLTTAEMQEFLQKEKWDDLNVGLISAEMLSIFNPQGKKNAHWAFYFQDLFPKQQTLHFFNSRQGIPLDFQGKFSVQKY